MTTSPPRRPLVALLLACAFLLPLAASSAGDADGHGKTFQPRPMSKARYDIQGPDADPDVQRRFVDAPDGTPIHIETHLPIGKPGGPAPGRVPTVLVMTPYAGLDHAEATQLTRHDHIVRALVPHGYAVTIAHVPGTGRSGGCIDINGPTEVDATAAVIDHLGREAPWSSGSVGMIGISYDAIVQMGVASLADPARISPLKAIVVVAGPPSEYEAFAQDGVQYANALATYTGLLYHGFYAPLPASGLARDPLENVRPERQACAAATLEARASIDLTGRRSEYWAERDSRAGAANVRAATLYVQGLTDDYVPPIGGPGWFDQLPATTPRKAVIGQWGHAWPDAAAAPFARADWEDLARAWLDRYLLDLPTKVESWPDVQVQDHAGRWRAADSWPDTGGRAAQLALAGDGSLGAATPTGASAVLSWSYDAGPGGAIFVTPPLEAPLHVTGLPVADLWLVTTDPRGRIAASLRAFDAEGDPLTPPSYGMRSLEFLEPMPRNHFEALEPTDAPMDVPLRVPVRLKPVDVVVPAGGWLELRVGGVHSGFCGTTHPATYACNAPSTTLSTMTLLHECGHASVLRFEIPPEDARSFRVRTPSGLSALAPRGPVDGGELATRPVCGAAPVLPGAVVRGEA